MFSFPYMVPHDLPPELQILKRQKQNRNFETNTFILKYKLILPWTVQRNSSHTVNIFTVHSKFSFLKKEEKGK